MHKAFQLHDVLKHNLLVLISIFTLLLSTLSCEQFYKVNNDAVIARAGNSFLYHSELENNITNFNTESDSIIQAENYINNWARKQLLINQAVINLDIESQEKLDELVSSYRSDLWSSAYKEFVVKSSIDTLISKKEIEQYYENNQNNFLLNETLLKIRYVALPSENIDILEIKEKLIRFNEEDVRFLDSLSFQFNSYEIRDSVWLSKRDLIKTLAVIEENNFEEYLKKSQFFLIEDSLEVYLLFVDDYLLRNEIAPLVSIENTIRKIVFNKRKLDFIRQFDKEILQDAIRTKKFELYR